MQGEASRQNRTGPPAPGGRSESTQAGLVFDLARFQGANGEGGGAGKFNSRTIEADDRCRTMKTLERGR